MKITDEELEHVKSHPKRGFDICQPLKSLEEILPCIRSHHERIDGGGYPDGLKEDDIPLKGMILAVADAFDAMTSDRPYREKMSPEQALAEIGRCAGAQFDSEVVKAFRRVYELTTPNAWHHDNM